MESAGVRYLRTSCFCIRNLTRSLHSLVRFLIRQQLVRKYRTPALSMKYSLSTVCNLRGTSLSTPFAAKTQNKLLLLLYLYCSNELNLKESFRTTNCSRQNNLVQKETVQPFFKINICLQNRLLKIIFRNIFTNYVWLLGHSFINQAGCR